MSVASLLAPLLLALTSAGERVVEPADLTRDPDLIGREVVVDDRVRYFQPGKGNKGQAIEEVLLKRTPVIFRLPPGLRPEHPPRQPAIRLTGILQQEGGQLYVDVTSYELLPPDLERLDREIKRLRPDDGPGRSARAKWAERRAADFKDAELAARARAIETEVVLIDAERPKADDLALARRARDRKLGDDLASALAHRGFRLRLASAKTADELAGLAAEVESFLPKSTETRRPPSDEWLSKMKSNPIAVYRNATEEIRAGLDRALLADILAQRLDLRLAASPGDALALADEAKAKLPDRPELARTLRDRGLSATEGAATTMRLSEVESLAKTFRDDGQPDRARKVLKDWLDDRRRKLNPSDADGHVLLADQYDRLLSDRGAAALLLSGALKADPEARGATDAFRRMGFRKSPDDGAWYDPKTADEPADAAKPAPRLAAPDRPAGSLRGMSPAQVRATLGSKPDRIVRVGTRDDAVEQWIYQGARSRTIVNFRCPRGRTRAEVIGNYSMP